MTDIIVLWTLLILILLAQGLIAIGMLGILISAFSDSFRERLTAFVTMVFAGIVLYLTTTWTAIVVLSSNCPGGGC